ncbi:hypothetical protein ACRRTK_017330 [Alexandromys fortis]
MLLGPHQPKFTPCPGFSVCVLEDWQHCDEAKAEALKKLSKKSPNGRDPEPLAGKRAGERPRGPGHAHLEAGLRDSPLPSRNQRGSPERHTRAEAPRPVLRKQ